MLGQRRMSDGGRVNLELMAAPHRLLGRQGPSSRGSTLGKALGKSFRMSEHESIVA